MSATTAPAHREAERSAGILWWIILAVGIVWSLFALAIPQFDLTTERSILVLLGIVLLVSAASELLATVATARDWRWSHALMAVLFLAAGVVALAWPDPTFRVVARIVGWYLLGKGIYDIINGFVARRAELRGAELREAEGGGLRTAAQWWLPLVIGAFEIGVAFWAVNYPQRSLSLLVLWVSLAALATGLTKIAMSARMRGVQRELSVEDMFPPTGFGVPAVTESARAHARAEESRARRPFA